MSMLKVVGDNVFSQSGIFEGVNMYISVMDSYRGYLAKDPGDNDMR